jgi:oxygen-independent coproporphyrinogen III oxidase
MSGIYLHIPFCRKACNYCNFHFSTQLKNKKAVILAMIGEIEFRRDYLTDKNLKTIYFGGGTPSLLEAAELGELMQVIRSQFSVDDRAEVTLEVNPDDVTTEALKSWKNSGANRLSIGIQSLDEAELKWMNRTHSASEGVASIYRAQDAGFDNITIDLIYGSRFMTSVKWEATLSTVEQLNVQHLSCYNLTAEENTALGINVSRKKEEKISEELSAEQFEILMDWANGNGFEQYEISNFAREGLYSKHNSSYWLGETYLGIGPSAHSFNGISRQWNKANNASYLAAIQSGQPEFIREEISEETAYHEYILTRLRTKWGVIPEEIQQRFSKCFSHFKQQLLLEIENGNVVETENKVILTRQGKLIADVVTTNFFTN